MQNSFAMILALMLGCSPGTDEESSDTAADTRGSHSEDSGGESGEELVVDIVSPVAGALVDVGTVVLLEAQVISQDPSVDPEGLTWTNGDESWSAAGNGLKVSDLPVGTQVLTATVSHGELTASDSVEISVVDATIYSGSMDAAVEYTYGTLYEDDGPCLGTVTFARMSDDSFSGTGECFVDLEYMQEDSLFVLEGAFVGDTVEGTLALKQAVDKGTPFTGTVDTQGNVYAEFDKAWVSGKSTLRIFGSFSAAPQ